MENTANNSNGALLDKALGQLAEDMENRELGAIIWNLATAGFHYLPELSVPGKNGETETIRVTGLRLADGKIFAIKEGLEDADISNFYTPEIDVPPVVVTLTPSMARETLGNPEGKQGSYTGGTTEEWLAIADCYFEALNEA